MAVGGTKLVLDASGRRRSEPVWNDNGLDNQTGSVRGRMGATGSGCSTAASARPAWQRAAPNYAHSGCNGKRFTADVSAVAAPSTGLDVYNTYGGHGWMTVGGTSLSSPLIAAMWALVGGARGVDAARRDAVPEPALPAEHALRRGDRRQFVVRRRHDRGLLELHRPALGRA